jgi:hypothetical protein
LDWRTRRRGRCHENTDPRWRASGKSRLAERLATDSNPPVTYIATATAQDDEMRAHRRPSQPEQTPTGLSAEFHADAQKNTQWNAFLRKGMLVTDPLSLADVYRFLETFLVPPTQALVRGQDFVAKWRPGGPWS